MMVVKIYDYYRSKSFIIDMMVGCPMYGRHIGQVYETNVFAIFLHKCGSLFIEPTDVIVPVGDSLQLMAFHKPLDTVENFMKHLAQHSDYLEKLYDDRPHDS